ncbi:MAG TPA: NosD domain-containing protein, partial [Acidimicrobiales bacterium]|nr:NosD domain-containing protein [Acidimicrobiales bacterium]
LTADMTCPGDGIVIGAPGVVLNLGGHTLTGGGTTGLLDEGVGVRVRNGQVTVRNGRIQDFRYGVHLDPGSDGSLIERLTLDRDGDGIHIRSSSNRVRSNSITRANVVAVSVSGGANVVEGNSMLDNLAGVFIVGFVNHIVANDIVGEAGDDRGILAFNETRIVGNRVSRYGGAAGIELFNGGEVSGNQVFATVDGIRVRGQATVTGNVVFANADDGIDAGAGAVLQGNIALQNADLGISAGPGVIDAGGNRAFANGNPFQCVGVACR